jgi:hypothetical protein
MPHVSFFAPSGIKRFSVQGKVSCAENLFILGMIREVKGKEKYCAFRKKPYTFLSGFYSED